MRPRILLRHCFVLILVVWSLAAAGEVHTLLVIGDTGECRAEGTGRVSLAMRGQPDWQRATLIEVGDLAYPVATRERLLECHEPYFAMFPRRLAAPGNHDWYDAGGRGFFNLFPDPVPRAVPLGGRWVLWLLNSSLRGQAATAQLRWLELAAQDSPGRCVIAAWHHPRWTSSRRGPDEAAMPMWRAVAGRATLTLHGHDHHYEAVPPRDGDGQPSATGTRSFVVGIGGAVLDSPTTPIAGSTAVFRQWGFLRLDLDGDDYRWQAVNAEGAVMDSGAGRCLASTRRSP